MSFAKCLQLCNHHPKADVECLCGPPKSPHGFVQPIPSPASSSLIPLTHCVLSAFSRTSCKWDYWVGILLYLTSFTQHVFGIHPHGRVPALCTFLFLDSIALPGCTFCRFTHSLWEDILFLFWGDFESLCYKSSYIGLCADMGFHFSQANI